jgi:uncharacterized Rossmann fold enzyme
MVALAKPMAHAGSKWLCVCEKCQNEVVVTDEELSARIPWPCRKCGESSILIHSHGDAAN